MSIFQQRHYSHIAGVIRRELMANMDQVSLGRLAAITNRLAEMFREDNSRFKHQLFLTACGWGLVPRDLAKELVGYDG